MGADKDIGSQTTKSLNAKSIFVADCDDRLKSHDGWELHITMLGCPACAMPLTVWMSPGLDPKRLTSVSPAMLFGDLASTSRIPNPTTLR